VKLRTVFTLHKLSGLIFGAILLLLGFTGFFLDHDNFDVLWDIVVSDKLLPESIIEKKQSAYNAYKVDGENPDHILAGSRMGLYVSLDKGESFKKTLNQQVLAIEPSRKNGQESYQILYTATTNGIYQSLDAGFQWQHFALTGKVVEALSQYNNKLYAVIDKQAVFQVDIQKQQEQPLALSQIPSKVLPKHITLSRLIRDLHYGRGLFRGDISLYINDVAAIILIFLSVSGFIIYFSIRRIRARKEVNRKVFKGWVNNHSNGFIILSFLPILMLLITGVFLDHSKRLQNFMKSSILQTSYLPPVYKDLSTDIWGFDFDGQLYRIGNRLGVFSSKDLQTWQLESKGFAYRIKRAGEQLYISGMGSPNKVLTQQGWEALNQTPHMPRDVYWLNNKAAFYSSHAKDNKLPQLDHTPLYYIILGLHDGKLFYGQWVFVNDASVIAGLILLITGTIKWQRRRLKKAK
jgi:hypothetical protein